MNNTETAKTILLDIALWANSSIQELNENPSFDYLKGLQLDCEWYKNVIDHLQSIVECMEGGEL